MNNYKYNPIKMTPFKWFVLENFPFIEEDFDSLTSYGLWCKLKQYFDKVAHNVNEMGLEVQKLSEAFSELEKYVDNYFKNLDVQDEINNKLDEMAEDGTLAQIIGDYAMKKLDCYIINTTMTQAEIQALLNIDRPKILSFIKGTYEFNDAFRLNENTKILLNGSVLKINSIHGMYNFVPTDEFLEYNGNGNIEIENGTLEGFCIAFCHANNIKFSDIKFKKTLSNHFIELGAINNCQIVNCSFEGQTNPTYKECIQIDDMTYSNMPYFDSSSNESYDLTHCKNIVVDGCYFGNGNDESYSLGTAIGMHTFTTDGKHHENITIINNTIDNPNYSGIRLNNTYNAIVKNNKFISDFNVSSMMMRFGYYCENIKIQNNVFTGLMYRCMYFSTNPVLYKDFIIEGNFIQNCLNTAVYGNRSLFIFNNPTNFIIRNNKFTNNDRQIFYINGDDIEIDDETPSSYYGSITFDKNIFITDTSTKSCIAIYNISNIEIINNIFEYAVTPSGSVVIFYDFDVIPLISGNVFNNKLLPNRTINLQSNSNLENVYNFISTLYSGNTQNFTEINPNVPFDKFNTLLLVIGKTTNTFTVVLQGYSLKSKLTARTYKIPFIDDNNELQIITLTLNSDGTITETNTSDSNFVRNIQGVNSLNI